MCDCSVCCETVSKRNVITCHFCDYITCKSCAKKYILEGTIAPVCMNCKKPWNREALTKNFGKTFIGKEYKQKRENDLFDTEKALMPETQEIAIRQKRMKDINKEIRDLQERIKVLKHKKRTLELEEEEATSKKGKSSAGPKMMIKCPVGDCRGFANMSTGYSCGICETKLCKDCHEPVVATEEDHTCDKNILETIQLLKKDTKNCPKCGVSIHKIAGCDQMYCTQCHTAFSWRTGEIVIGERIHNPHYFEYLRRTGGGGGGGADIRREIGDIPCGGLPTDWEMRQYYKNTRMMQVFRLVTHIERVEFRNYRTDRIENNRDLRIKYLNGEITEDQFKRTLQKREKDVEKKREILQVLNTHVVAGSDIFRKLLRENNEQKAIDEMEELTKFTNESMEKISKLFVCVVPVIESQFVTKRKY